jgi:DNA-binding beta-propeller fold protein YncE
MIKTPTRRRAGSLLALVAVLVAAPLAWGLGELSQKPGTAGCVSETGSGGACQDGRALLTALATTVSPDGRNVYVAAGDSSAVAVFDRDALTGALTQKPGVAGCTSEDGTGGLCRDGEGLRSAFDVVATRDGRSVYVAALASSAVTSFDRDAATGSLTQKAGAAGCVSDDGSGGACQDGTALAGAFRLAASPDGKNVYVTAHGSGAVAVFDRDPVTGALTQKPGSAGCISHDGTGGACQTAPALFGVDGAAVSPDGRNVYAVAEGSNAVVVFSRDSSTGALTATGCIADDGSGVGCQDGAALLGASSVTASPDGKTLYVASVNSAAVTVFDRDPATGALTQKPGTAGCVSEDGTAGACRDGVALEGAIGVDVSPDGKSVYVAARNVAAVAIFDRDAATGALTQKAGLPCISETGAGACADGTALEFPMSVASSPDNRSLYVAAAVSHAVAIFDRATPSEPPPAPSPPPDTLAPTVTGFAVTPRRFRVARDARASSGRARRGARLRLTLSERADARIVIARRVASRYKRVGTLTRRNLPAGRTRIRFSGRVGRRALAPGRYRASVKATDPAGNRSSATRASFRVVR